MIKNTEAQTRSLFNCQDYIMKLIMLECTTRVQQIPALSPLHETPRYLCLRLSVSQRSCESPTATRTSGPYQSTASSTPSSSSSADTRLCKVVLTHFPNLFSHGWRPSHTHIPTKPQLHQLWGYWELRGKQCGM